jgi:tRNA(adenine34) deaminase
MSDADLLGMAMALAEARKAACAGDVPVGCIIVDPSGRVLARARNEREATGDPTAHAEIVALRKAAEVVGHWRLLDTTMYVTLEPCAMCAGALVNARVARVVWGADDPKWGAMRSRYAIGHDGKLNHEVAITAGVLADRCVDLLREFFAARRPPSSSPEAPASRDD